MRVHDGPRSWTERMKDRALCWIVEKIAEQRLLWRLRNETELMPSPSGRPDDRRRDPPRARRASTRSRSPHEVGRSSTACCSWRPAALVLVPGPNVIALLLRFPARRSLSVPPRRQTRAHRDQLVRVCEPAALTLASRPRAWARRARSRGARSGVGAASAASRQVLRADLRSKPRDILAPQKTQEIRSSEEWTCLVVWCGRAAVARGESPRD